MVLQHSSEKTPTLTFNNITCQCRDFLTELCCNIIISCFSIFHRSIQAHIKMAGQVLLLLEANFMVLSAYNRLCVLFLFVAGLVEGIHVV